VPYLPRWACDATLGTAVDGSFGLFSALLPSGLFAWNGVLGFWLPVASFFVWLVFIMLPFTLRAMREEALQAGDRDRDLAYQNATIIQ
jgi:hypothetical protein